jgi:hypothetical protein
MPPKKLSSMIIRHGIERIKSHSKTVKSVSIGLVFILIGLSVSCTEKLDRPIEARQVKKYDRSYFTHWIDDNHNCLNTRHELLKRQSLALVKTGDNKCTVSRGKWLDPYTGKIFYNPSDVDIDHIIPLKWAWDHGAYGWTSEKRKQFANDDSNLLVVKNSINRQKGARGALSWLPPLKSFHYPTLDFN